MGNCFSLCSSKTETDQENTQNPITMTKEVVYQTTPYEGQKPGTSGNIRMMSSLCLLYRIEKESQGVYAKELHRELCPGRFFFTQMSNPDHRLFLKQFPPLEQKVRLLSLAAMVASITKKQCKLSLRWLLPTEYRLNRLL